MLNLFPAITGAPRFYVGTLAGKTLLVASAFIALMTAAPTNSRADSVGAAFGAGTGLLVAGAARGDHRRRGRCRMGTPILGAAKQSASLLDR